jgi:hypothetical protein
MKSFKVLFLVIVSGFVISLSGCKKPEPTPPTVEEEQFAKLSKAWKIKKVTFGSSSSAADKTTDYANFVLIISGTSGSSSFNYAVTGRPSTSPWPASGTWVFGTNPVSQLVRDPTSTTDKLDMTYSVSDSEMQMGFTFSGTGYTARTSVVSGAWVFTFVPQ